MSKDDRIRAGEDLTETPLFVSGEGGYHTYRIPALIVAPDGTVLAICEGRRHSRSDTGEINILLRRSTDAGRTWGEVQLVTEDGPNAIDNPCPVVDEDTGVVWLLLTHNLGHDGEKGIIEGTSDGTRTAWVTYSEDNGATWSERVDITDDVKAPEWTWYATGPGVGIQLTSGRLVVPCDDSVTETKESFSHVIFSDDHGTSWQYGAATLSGPGTNECQVTERRDGSLLLNIRQHPSLRRRRSHACTIRAFPPANSSMMKRRS